MSAIREHVGARGLALVQSTTAIACIARAVIPIAAGSVPVAARKDGAVACGLPWTRSVSSSLAWLWLEPASQ
jgi:hypothetical protein